VSWMLIVWTMVTVACVLVLTLAVMAGGTATAGASVTKNPAEDAAEACVVVVPPASTVYGWGWYGSVVVVTGATTTGPPEEDWGFGPSVVAGAEDVSWDVVDLVMDVVVDLAAGLVVDVAKVVGPAAAGVLDVDPVTTMVCVRWTVCVTVVSAETVDDFVVGGAEGEGEAVGEATVMPRTASAVWTLAQPTSTPYWFGSGIAKQLVPEDGEQASIVVKVLELASHSITLPPMHAIWLAVQRELRVKFA
jgi:hypothetical protein